MITLEEIKNRLTRRKSKLTKKYAIKRLGIFGSYVRGEQNRDSDLDMLIDYRETPTLIELIELENNLGELAGLKVDLVTLGGIKPQLRDFILGEVVYL